MIDEPEAKETPSAAVDAEPHPNGRPLDEQVADVPGEPEQTALAIPGPARTLASIVGRKPVEVQVSMRRAGVRADGLLDPDNEVTLVVPALPFDYGLSPKREDGQTKRFVVTQDVRPLEVLTVKQSWPRLVAELEDAYAENEMALKALDRLRGALEAADGAERAELAAAAS